MYVESHAHYDDSRYDADRDNILQKALPAAGVDIVVNIGACMQSSQRSLALADRYDYIYAAVGVHPHDVSSMTDADLDKLEALCAHPKTVAVGEIGLDYHYDNSPRDAQQHWFQKQLELAARVGLPIVIHSREAAEHTFNAVRRSDVRRGVVHCYSGASEMALEYVDMGFHIGVGGVVTFPNAKNLVKTVEAIPLERILIETDAPYLSPAPKRGQRNDSRNLCYICDKIGQIKRVPSDEIARITAKNAMSLFGIK